jgi:FkbM family methyltransferase
MKTINLLMAGLPAPLKGHLLYKFGSKILQAQPFNGETISTNLGIKSHFHLKMPANNPLFAFGNPMTYKGERGVLFLSKALCNKVDAVADIGANWGYFSYFIGHLLNGQKPLFYFEPNGSLFSIIQENMAENGLKKTFGFKKGISSYTGTATFFVNLTNDLSSSLDGTFKNEGEEILEQSIEVLSFDDFLEQQPSMKKWLVKVDIENAEPEFIKGAAKHIDRVEFLIIEFLEKARKAKLADLLTDQFGLNAFYINDFTLEYMPKEDGRYTPPEYNFLFCRQSPEALSKLLKGTNFTVKG